MSNLTGETRESKAKAYAAKESKRLALQYIGIIANLQSTHNKEIEDMKATLDASLLQLQLNNDASGEKEDSMASNVNYEEENKLLNTRKLEWVS